MSDLLGIDLGTSNIKVGRYSDSGRLVSIASNPYRQPDEYALSLERIWDALVNATREVTASTRDGEEVSAIGISSQVNSFALIDGSDAPITDVFLWTGNWAEAAAARINRECHPGATIHAVGMGSLTGQLMLPKCVHLREQQPTAWRSSRGIRQLADLVTHRLTGEHVTSPSLWSLTGFYDLAGNAWWSTALERLMIQAEMLPTLAPMGSVAGRLREDVAQALHLPAGIPVAVGTLDHLAGAISLGNLTPRCASLSIGTTSCVVVTHAHRPPAMANGVVGRHPADTNLWFALTWSGLSTTGVNWCVEQNETSAPLDEMIAAACNLPEKQAGWIAQPHDPNDGQAGFAFLPPLNAPTETDAQPAPSQQLRAVIHCINEEIERLLDEARAAQSLDAVAVTGGGARSDAWMQLLASHLRLPVHRPDSTEACVRGAAMLAALAAGRITSLNEVPSDASQTFTPEHL